MPARKGSSGAILPWVLRNLVTLLGSEKSVRGVEHVAMRKRFFYVGRDVG